MKRTTGRRSIVLPAILFCLVLAIAMYPPFRSYAQTSKGKTAPPRATQDTTRRKSAAPGHTNPTAAEVSKEIERAMQQLEVDMKRLNNEELPKVQEEIAKAMKEVDAAAIKMEVEKSLRSVDFERIDADMRKAMKEMKAAGVKVQSEQLMQQADIARLQQELASIKEIEMEKISRNMEQVKAELGKVQVNVQAEMEKAKKHMEKAKVQMELVKSGIDELIKDGLIKETDPVNIEWNNDRMILNGAVQSAEVSAKYKKYFAEGNFHFTQRPKGIVL